MYLMVIHAFLVMLLLAAAPPPEGALRAIDVYGTNRFTATQASREFGPKIRAMAAAFQRRDVSRFIELQEQVGKEVRRKGPFAFARVSLIQTMDSGKPYYATIDVVEERDRARRMDFLPPPSGTFSDPGGVLALWREYETKGTELLQRDELNVPRPDACPVFHCLFGFEHPELAPYLPRLNTGARTGQDALFRTLREDRDPEHRAAAAFVLAHTEDAGRLTVALVRAMRDPDAHVRNNAMRVLAMISLFHPQTAVPLPPVLKAIDYPETTDRNKALYILDGLADRAPYRPQIARAAGPVLLRLLRLRQPNNHDPAWSILKKISGKQYGERDNRRWSRWVARHRADR